MNPSEKWDQVVTKLIHDTEAGTIIWNKVLRPDRADVEGFVYSAKVDRKELYLYEYNYKHYTDEDVWDWVPDVAIEFVGNVGKLEWKLPETSGRWALLELVRKKDSGADDFADRFLGAKSEPSDS